MDSSAILAGLSQTSPLVALLCLVIWYLHKRDQRNESGSERRHRACEERNTTLEQRIKGLEDRQFSDLAALTKDALEGLSMSYDAIIKFCNDNELTPPPRSRPRIVDRPNS